jgi:hypothetical protein
MPTRDLALRFLSGRYQGATLALDPRRALVLGRGPGVDLKLTDDAVSRRHARFSIDGDAFVVEDLGSTNGTYLNGARVSRARLALGDRVLVGGSMLRVVAREAGVPVATAAEVSARQEPAAAAAAGRKSSALQGRIEDIPLVDVMQLCATTRKSGTLVVQDGRRVIEVSLVKGHVVGASLDGRRELPAEKCFYRVLSWRKGQFELKNDDPASAEEPPRSAASVEALLLEGMRQLDELNRLRPSLPAHVALAPQPPPEDLAPEERALLALARAHGAVDDIVDAAPLTDLEAAEWLATLLRRGVLVEG